MIARDLFFYAGILLLLFPVKLTEISGLNFRVDELSPYLILMAGFPFNKKNTVDLLSISKFKYYFLYFLLSYSVGLVFSIVNSGLQNLLFYLTRDASLLMIVLGSYSYFTGSSGSNKVHKMKSYLLVFSAANIVYAVFQLITGDLRGYYGISALFLEGSSIVNGFYFFVIFAFVYYLFLKNRSMIFLLGLLISFVLLLTTGVRSFVVLAILLVVFNFIKLSPRIIFYSIILAMVYSIFYTYFYNPECVSINRSIEDRISFIVERIFYLTQAIDCRLYVLSNVELSSFDAISYLFGNGRGAYESYNGVIRNVMHSQFSRIIIENGFIGLLLLLVFFYYISCKTRVHILYKYFSLLILISFFSVDSLNIPRIGNVFFVFVSFVLYLDSINRKSDVSTL